MYFQNLGFLAVLCSNFCLGLSRDFPGHYEFCLVVPGQKFCLVLQSLIQKTPKGLEIKYCKCCSTYILHRLWNKEKEANEVCQCRLKQRLKESEDSKNGYTKNILLNQRLKKTRIDRIEELNN